jgi:hypothetical protein
LSFSLRQEIRSYLASILTLHRIEICRSLWRSFYFRLVTSLVPVALGVESFNLYGTFDARQSDFIFFSEPVLYFDQNHEVWFCSLIHCVVATSACGDVLMEDCAIAKNQSRATVRCGALFHLLNWFYRACTCMASGCASAGREAENEADLEGNRPTGLRQQQKILLRYPGNGAERGDRRINRGGGL